MRKIFSVIFVALFALTMCQTGFAVADYGRLAEVTSTNFLPSTVHAGDTISLAVDINNRGTAITIKDLNATLEIGSQFDIIDVQDSLNEIKPGATKTVIFKFRAKEDTLSGYYPSYLIMEYSREDQRVSDEQTISIPVSKTEKNLEVTVEPNIINPGNQTELLFIIRNIGGTGISNVSFSWDEENDLILPLGSDNKKYLNSIPAGTEEIIKYNVAADPNISPGIYPIDVSISFTDAEGTKTQNSQVGLIIGGKTDFEISAEVKSSQLSLSIANIGSNNAESVVVKIPEQNSVKVSGTSIEIVGNLNKGDFTIANFTISGGASAIQTDSTATAPTRSGIMIPGLGGGRTNTNNSSNTEEDSESTTPNIPMVNGEVIVQIDYTDTTGERNSVTKTVELNNDSSTTSFSTSMPSQRNTGLPLIPIAFALLVIGCAAGYNHFRAKKDWKELGKRLGVIAVLFIAAIFLLNSDLIAMGVVTAISAGLLWKFFKGK